MVKYVAVLFALVACLFVAAPTANAQGVVFTSFASAGCNPAPVVVGVDGGFAAAGYGLRSAVVGVPTFASFASVGLGVPLIAVNRFQPAFVQVNAFRPVFVPNRRVVAVVPIRRFR